MVNPYEPPLPERKRIPAVFVRFAVAAFLVTVVMFVVWPVVQETAPSWKIVGGPFWYRSETGNELVGGMLIVFCLATMQSALICPNRYTALVAMLGAAVWVGAGLWTAAFMAAT